MKPSEMDRKAAEKAAWESLHAVITTSGPDMPAVDALYVWTQAHPLHAAVIINAVLGAVADDLERKVKVAQR